MMYGATILCFFFGLTLGLIIADKDIVLHVLKNPKTGNWSRKNLTGFISLFFAMFYAGHGMVHEKQIQEFVVTSFLLLTATCFGISAYEKNNILKSQKIEDPTEG